MGNAWYLGSNSIDCTSTGEPGDIFCYNTLAGCICLASKDDLSHSALLASLTMLIIDLQSDGQLHG